MNSSFRGSLLARSLINPDASVEIMANSYFSSKIASQLKDPRFCASTVLSLISQKTEITEMPDFVAMCFSKVYQNSETQTVAVSMLKELLAKNFVFGEKELTTILEVIIKCQPNANDRKICCQLIQNICCLSNMASLEFLHHLEPNKFTEKQRSFLREACKMLLLVTPAPLMSAKDTMTRFINVEIESSKTEIYGETPTQKRMIRHEREKKIDEMFGKPAFSSRASFIIVTVAIVFILSFIATLIIGPEDQ